MNRAKYLVYALISLIFLGGLVTYQTQNNSDGKLHIIFCDVGQGDAIYIRTSDKKDIVIDGGPDDSVLKCLEKNMPFWDKTLELMVLTHPHEDHLNGLIFLLNRYNLIHYATENWKISDPSYKKLQKLLADKNLTANYLTKNDYIDLTSQIKLKTVWSGEDYVDISSKINDLKEQDYNLNALAGLLTYKNFSILFASDLPKEALNSIAFQVGDIDVLKIPHHGSSTGLSETSLDRLTPELSVISVGKNNRYKHPSKTILKLLSDKKIKTLRTDINGEIEIVTDGSTWSVKVEKN